MEYSLSGRGQPLTSTRSLMPFMIPGKNQRKFSHGYWVSPLRKVCLEYPQILAKVRTTWGTLVKYQGLDPILLQRAWASAFPHCSPGDSATHQFEKPWLRGSGLRPPIFPQYHSSFTGNSYYASLFKYCFLLVFLPIGSIWNALSVSFPHTLPYQVSSRI